MHTEVVVILGAELLRRQLERGDNLLGEHFCSGEAEGIQTDLCNHGIVGNHHGDWAEEGL